MTRPTVTRVNGPVVELRDTEGIAMLDLVDVGPHGLPGEVIALEGGRATVQVYEYTGGLRPGDTVRPTGAPLSARLGPGLLGGVFDGMLRPLRDVDAWLGPDVRRAVAGARAWPFEPAARQAAEVVAGDLLGRVADGRAVEHRVLVPPGMSGTLEWIAGARERREDEAVATVAGRPVTLEERWPVRRPRPFLRRLPAAQQLFTGQRVVDLLFPVARGSTAAIPGGFGTGKTVMLQQIAKWCDADVIVYVGCGERGNELADVLTEFAELVDPRSGRALLERTVIVANTSNMPVMAREASIYTAVTVAEYFRDMGHDAVVIADSTSRWAEALREVASRTGELPAEEGYPAGLSAALAAFYERAGLVETASGGAASVTILGAVSPPGADLAEPVTAHTRRFVRAVWSLDRDLAYARHYPAIGWSDSSSRDADLLARARAEDGDGAWGERRRRVLRLLAHADELESIAQLVGSDALPAAQRAVLLGARAVREGVLQQSALDRNDRYSTPAKQDALLQMALDVSDRLVALAADGTDGRALAGVDLSAVIHARSATAPDGAAAVRSIAAGFLADLIGPPAVRPNSVAPLGEEAG